MTRTTRALLVLALILGIVATAPAALAASTPAPVRWSTPHLADATAPFSSPTTVHGIACPQAGDCLGVGADGTVVHLDAPGGPVTQTGIDGGRSLASIACPSTTLCVATGSTELITSTTPTSTRTAWRTAAPLHGAEYLGVTCGSASLCVAWSDTDVIEVSTDPAGGAGAWHEQTLASSVSSVACVPQTTTCVASLQSSATGAPFAVSTDPAAGAGSWTTTTATAPGTAPARALACPSASLCVGTTDGGDIETSTDPQAGGASWSAGQVISGIHTGFTGIACADASHCVATVNDGSVLQSADPAAGAPGYARSAVLDTAGFGTANVNEIACPTTAECLVPDQTPGVATVALGPPPSATVAAALGGFTRITGLACPATYLCVGVDAGGAVIHSATPSRQTTPWRRTVQSGATAGLAAVSCPTTRFCAAVGADDHVATTARPGAATQWRQATLPFTYPDDEGGPDQPYDLTSVSCPSYRFCLAGNGEYGLMYSAHPAGGASTWHFDKLAAFNADAWDSVSCPSSRFCVAGDGNFGRVAVSTQPTRSGRAWHLFKIAPGVGSEAPAISAVSCPSTRFCLAGDGRGAVHWSTRPNGGPGAWHAARIDTTRLIAVRCRSSRFCVAVDGAGRAFASTDPERGLHAWHRVQLATGRFSIAGPGQRAVTALACAPHHLCLAGNGIGAVFPGSTAT